MNYLKPETVMKVILLIIICSIASLVEVSANVFDPLVKREAYFIKAIEQSKKTEFGKNKIIAILDTGINDNNYELKDQVIAEYDFTTDSSVAIDHNGHGTKMASIIAAKNNGQGMTGIAYNAKLIDVKVVDDSGSISTENIIKGIHFAVKHSANIINMSFSSGEYSEALEQVIEKYSKDNVLFVAAAGNDGTNAITYPAGYQNVTAVSSLKRGTEEKAIYANYGDFVDEYIEDGIWTYDGGKLAREYGTSETAAIVSSYIIENTKVSFSKNIPHFLSGYKLATAPSIENITFDALLESNDGSNYLNSLIKYILIQEETKTIIGKINEMELVNIDSKYSHSISADAMNGYSNKVLSEDLFARLFLFDLFGKYAELMIPDYNEEEKLLGAQKIQTIMGIIDNTISVLNGSNGYTKSLISFNKKIKEIVLSTEGKKDTISKMIRKFVRIYAGEASSKDITSFKPKILAGNIDNANNILQGLELLKKGLEIVKKIGPDLSGNLKKQAYMQIWAIDYVMAMHSMNINNAFSTRDTKVLNITAMQIILDAATNETIDPDTKKTKLEEFVDGMKYMGFYTFGLATIGDAVDHLIDSGLSKLEDDSPSVISLIKNVIINLLKNDIEEGKSVYKYNMYRNFLSGLHDHAFTLQDNKKLGFISSKYILTNIMSNIALKEFTFHAFVYLKSAFKNQQNWTPIQTNITNIQFELGKYGLTRDASSYQYSEINTKDYIKKHVVNSLSMLPSAIFSDAYSNIKFSLQSITKGAAADKTLKFDTGYTHYQKKLNEANGSETDVIQTIFKDDFNYFVNTMTKYEKVLMDMYSANYVYDLIIEDNNNEEAEARAKAQIVADIEKASVGYVPAIPQRVKNNIRDSIIIGANFGATLINRELFDSINERVTRKDFMVMMMISALDEYNPFGDVNFLTKLLSGELSKNFIDIDDDFSGKKLTTVEKIWILYGADKGLINGYPDGSLKPFNEITRKEAFALYGRLIKQSNLLFHKVVYSDQNTEELLTGGVKSRNRWGDTVKTEIADYSPITLENFRQKCSYNGEFQTLEEITNLDQGQAENIKTAYLSDIFGGSIAYYSLEKETKVINSITYNYTHYVEKRLLELSRNLSNYEASVIAKKMFLQYSAGSFRWLSIPMLKGEGSGFTKHEECFPGAGIIKGVLSLTKAYSNKPKELMLSTKITEDNETKYKISWEALSGNLDSFQRYFGEDGLLKSSVVFTPKEYSEPTIVPITATIENFKGEQAHKTFYIQVLPYEEYIDNSGDSNEAVSNTQLSAIYKEDTDTYTINWQGTQDVNQVTVFSSFDNINWIQLFSHNLQQGSHTVTIPDSKNHNKIYFKVTSTDTVNNTSTTSNPQSFSYAPKITTVTPKETEKPSIPQLRDPGKQTSNNSVTLYWSRVNDSNYKDNVNYYEVKVADNYSFNNGSIVNAGNNAAGQNIYESASYTAGSLIDDKTYYFRVRAVNNAGTSSWSGYQSITINLEDAPYFDMSYQNPNHLVVGVSKTPTLRWRAYDKDGDDLEYYLSVGESPITLHNVRGFKEKEGQNWFDYSAEDIDLLKPSTKYYWQVMVRESGSDKASYGGEYLKSDIWNFTTVSSGPDLSITNAELIGELKPGSNATFRLTVKNVGNEKAVDEFIQAYYKKGTKVTQFNAGSVRMTKGLNPGETEIIDVVVKFKDEVIPANSYNGFKERDNVLITGDSQVVFDMPYLDEQDANPSNNRLEKIINYANQGKPVFENFSIGPVSVYNNEHDFPLYTRIEENIGRLSGVNFKVVDDLTVTKATIEYRLNQSDSWHLITTIQNSFDSMSEDYQWLVPSSDSFVTESMQIRVRAYESNTSFSERVSYSFPVYSNKFALTIDRLDKANYAIGDNGAVYFHFDRDYAVQQVIVKLVSGNGSKIELYNEFDKNGLIEPAFIEFNIPTDNGLAAPDSYLEFSVYDVHGNQQIVESDRFILEPQVGLPAPFNNMIDIYNVAYQNFPSGSKSQGTDNSIKHLFVDDNDIVHMIIYHEGHWIESSTYYRHGTYFYISYDYNSKAISSPIKIYEVTSGANLPTISLKDMTVIDGIPYIMTHNTRGDILETYNFNGASFIKNQVFSNKNVLNNDYNFAPIDNEL